MGDRAAGKCYICFVSASFRTNFHEYSSPQTTDFVFRLPVFLCTDLGKKEDILHWCSYITPHFKFFLLLFISRSIRPFFYYDLYGVMSVMLRTKTDINNKLSSNAKFDNYHLFDRRRNKVLHFSASREDDLFCSKQ